MIPRGSIETWEIQLIGVVMTIIIFALFGYIIKLWKDIKKLKKDH